MLVEPFYYTHSSPAWDSEGSSASDAPGYSGNNSSGGGSDEGTSPEEPSPGGGGSPPGGSPPAALPSAGGLSLARTPPELLVRLASNGVRELGQSAASL